MRAEKKASDGGREQVPSSVSKNLFLNQNSAKEAVFRDIPLFLEHDKMQEKIESGRQKPWFDNSA